MSYLKLNRRTFLGGAASALSLAAFPRFAEAAGSVRLEWQQFKATPQYPSFLHAVQTMRANKNANDPGSWQYWVNVHVNYCPHKTNYFLAWHRGYLWWLEQQLKTFDQNLMLPYWDWYTNPTVPTEFTNAATGNALYVPRVNTNVYSALDLSPFSAANFQRGTVNSFEDGFETRPHNPVHNLIGNVMSSMVSPTDPIFFLHHCNIDRLWHAWALPDGRTMPVTSAPYWTTQTTPPIFTYAPNKTMPKDQTYSPRRQGAVWPNRTPYDYANTARPQVLPLQSQAGRIIRVQGQGRDLTRPPIAFTAGTPPRDVTADRRSIGGVKGVALREQSVSALVTAEASSVQPLQDVIATTTTEFPEAETTDASGPAPAASSAAKAKKFRSVKIVLDNIKITGAGTVGGYFYNVYLDLPDNADIETASSKHLLGTLGAFEIAGESHHGSVTLEYPATGALVRMRAKSTREHVISFVRVSGATAPAGEVIAVGEVRVELTTEVPFVKSKRVKPGRDDVPY